MSAGNDVDEFELATRRHGEFCRCYRCLASSIGTWIDGLSADTSTGRWQIFGTATFRTPDYPWQKGFPMGCSYKPSPHFVHRNYDQLIRYLESQLHSLLDYFVADHLGAINGRLHQHFILAAPGLDQFPRTKIWKRLFDRAGFSRILPFERGRLTTSADTLAARSPIVNGTFVLLLALMCPLYPARPEDSKSSIQ
jgi:hypothetical protein